MLREYGRRMQRRAQREQLRRSSPAARQLQDLGAQMASGALTRRKVLDRLGALSAGLDEERRANARAGLSAETIALFDPRPGLTVVARDGVAGKFEVVKAIPDVLQFLVSERYFELRKDIGLAL